MLSLIKDSKIYTNNRMKVIGRYLPGSDLSPSFLKTATSDEDFQQEGKQDSSKDLLYSLASRRKFWGIHLNDNDRNSAGASGFGCIKITDCTSNHFGSDILTAKSLFSTR